MQDNVLNDEVAIELPKDEMKYGEKIVRNFNVDTDLEVWENKHNRDYMIKITLPEFCCLCPRSGYPDFATIYIEYIPAKLVVELKAIKLYINSFMNRNISHEDSINEIYSVLENKISPKYMKIIGDFNPRGNVHTVIEICSENVTNKKEVFKSEDNYKAGARRISEREKDMKRDNEKSRSDKNKRDDKPKKSDRTKNGFRKPVFQGDKKPRVVKKIANDKFKTDRAYF